MLTVNDGNRCCRCLFILDPEMRGREQKKRGKISRWDVFWCATEQEGRRWSSCETEAATSWVSSIVAINTQTYKAGPVKETHKEESVAGCLLVTCTGALDHYRVLTNFLDWVFSVRDCFCLLL